MNGSEAGRVAPGINIFSGTAGLGGALTNPTVLARRKGSITRDYPVTYRGVVYPDAEAAFQAHARGLSFADEQALCVEIVIAKLEQHARLADAIDARGGVAWLKRCWHRTGARSDGFRRWEGHGEESPFLRCLVVAYAVHTLSVADPELIETVLAAHPVLRTRLRATFDK